MKYRCQRIRESNDGERTRGGRCDALHYYNVFCINVTFYLWSDQRCKILAETKGFDVEILRKNMHIYRTCLLNNLLD